MKNSADLRGCYPASVEDALLDLQNSSYRKIPKALFEGLILGGGGLSTEGNLRFKIDWASLIVGRKFTVFALLDFVLRAISNYKPPGGRLIFGGAI